MNGTIYTIGYSGFSIEDFVKKIKNNNINCVIDVRSSPFSKYFPQYNKEFVKKYLNNNNILYMNFLEFGARQTDPKFFNPKGYLDFEKYTQSLSFLHGTERVVNGIAKGYNIALMCAEKEPSHCHRTIMISRWFDKNDFNIIHFMPNNIRNKKQKDYVSNNSENSENKTTVIDTSKIIVDDDVDLDDLWNDWVII